MKVLWTAIVGTIVIGHDLDMMHGAHSNRKLTRFVLRRL
jgi:hypothetical protein